MTRGRNWCNRMSLLGCTSVVFYSQNREMRKEEEGSHGQLVLIVSIKSSTEEESLGATQKVRKTYF